MCYALVIIGCWKHETIEITETFVPKYLMTLHDYSNFFNMHIDFEQTCDPFLGSESTGWDSLTCNSNRKWLCLHVQQ